MTLGDLEWRDARGPCSCFGGVVRSYRLTDGDGIRHGNPRGEGRGVFVMGQAHPRLRSGRLQRAAILGCPRGLT